MARPAHPLRAAFEAALAAHLAANGPDFERSALVKTYVDRGASAATVYRWVNAVLAQYEASPAQLAGASTIPPATPAETGIATKLAPLPNLREMRALGVLPVVDLLQEAIRSARDLMAHARTPDGAVRNARLLAQGAEHLRRAVETATRLNDSVVAQQEMQRFHDVVMEEIGREPAAVQERLFMRLRRACDQVIQDGGT